MPQMPLAGAPPTEVPLPNAPLVLVIAQVRYPTLLAIRNQDRLAGFQEAIRSTYPFLEREEVRLVTTFGPDGGTDALVHWRFWNETRRWRATLTQDFLSLESLEYSSRDDFVGKLDEIVQAFAAAFKPTHTTRLGMRYIDQIVPPNLDRIEKLLRPEVLGVFNGLGGAHPEHLITQLAVNAEPGRLVARWGFLPKGNTPDPIVAPIEESSWILDLDVGLASNTRFSVTELVRDSRACAERIYSIFRWIVTDDFLIEYGGEVK
jgi:uncharacterized protein (TIGR04255 family)